MVQDGSPDGLPVPREAACRLTFQALRRGLKTADYLHSIAEWNPAADMHLHRAMTRRDAMEDLKQLNPELEDDDNLGLQMSGLILHLPEDIIRVWHTTEAFIPTPASESGRRFVSQQPERALQLFDGSLALDIDEDPVPEPDHLIIQWTAQGQELLRFDLVRPSGYTGARVVVDWRLPLLARYSPAPSIDDLRYRRRDDEEGRGEADGQ